MTSYKKYILIIVIIHSFFIIPLSCSKNNASSGSEEQQGVIKTLTVPITQKKVIPNIHSFGTISVKKSLEVTTAVEGIVENIYVDESEYVNKDQVLLTIRDIQLEISQEKARTNLQSSQANLELKKIEYEDSKLSIEAKFISLTQQEKQLEVKKAELENFEKKLQQQEELLELNGVSQEEVNDLHLQHNKLKTEYTNAQLSYESARIGYRDSDLVRNGYDVPKSPDAKKELLILLNTRSKKAQVTFAEASVAVAQGELRSIDILVEQLTIKAPISGTIISKAKEVGERTKKDDVIFTLIDDSNIEIVFSLPDSSYKAIKKIKSIEVTVPTLKQAFNADIRIISPVVDPQSGNITIKANITDKIPELKHGMYAEVTMITGDEYIGNFIPTQSLIEKNGNEASVYKVVNDHLIKQRIEIGTEEGETIEVSKGLKKNDIVVYKILPSLKEGTKIEAIPYNN